MKILVVIIVIFALNGYITRVSSLDPIETFEMEDIMNNDNEDTRNKRSEVFFSSLKNKKLRLLGSLSGSSSSKSIDHPGSFQQPPLSYHTKSFDLWGVKRAIFTSVLQAAKAITGGVIALKGQLIKAKGHVVVAKGNLMQTRGQAISNFGKTIATHAFDEHHAPPPSHHVDVHSSVGLYNHLPATPVHQPTSYGVPSAVGGYQEQVYSNNAYHQNNGYHGSPRYPTAPSSDGYGGDSSDYSGYSGGNSYSTKRAVQNNAHKLTINQLTNTFGKDTIRAGLLLFKPIKLPQTVPGGSRSVAFQNSGLEHLFIKRPSKAGTIIPQQHFKTPSSQDIADFPMPFPKFLNTPTTAGEEYSSYPLPTYVAQQNTGQQLHTLAAYQPFPPNGDDGSSDIGEQASVSPPAGHDNYGFLGYKSQESVAGREDGSQETDVFSGNQQQSYRQDSGYDQNDSASVSQERDSQATNTVDRNAEKSIKPNTAAYTKRFVSELFVTPTPKRDNDQPTSSIKRSVPKNDHQLTTPTHGSVESSSIKYDSNSSRVTDEQDALKQAIQRFLSLLQ